MKRPRNLRKKLLLIVFGLLMGLLMSEVFLRVIGYSYPLFYTTDYYRGYALRPGMWGRYQREGGSDVVINSDGLRDREHAKAKPAGTVRIAVLGDSFTEAMHVPLEQTYWSVLERKLQDCNAFSGKRVEVINFGVSGYGTAQELMTLRQKVWDYSPDIVMLAFTTYNDVYDNSRVLSKTQDIPYFFYQDGELVYDASFRESRVYRQRESKLSRLGRWFHDHLRFVQLLHSIQFTTRLRLADWRKSRVQAPSQQLAGSVAPKGPPTADDVGMENMTYLEPPDENWREAWRVTEGLIVKMHNEVNQKGSRFVLVTLSNAIQVYPDERVRQNFMKHLGLTTMFYPNQRLKDLAGRENIEFVDLAEPMQAYADQNKVFLHGFGNYLENGHWNAEGHRVAATMIAQKLCQSR